MSICNPIRDRRAGTDRVTSIIAWGVVEKKGVKAGRCAMTLPFEWRTKGEYIILRNAMPVMRCRVSFLDSDGTEHAVEIEAETLYDAVGLAIALFHDAPDAMLCISPRGRFTVEIRQPTTTHTVEYAAFAKWMNKPFGQPRDLAIRAKLRELLKTRPVVVTGMG